ncbi:hypothetical protein V1506DRAFT_515873 [Lipomyces tetrasporus]
MPRCHETLDSCRDCPGLILAETSTLLALVISALIFLVSKTSRLNINIPLLSRCHCCRSPLNDSKDFDLNRSTKLHLPSPPTLSSFLRTVLAWNPFVESISLRLLAPAAPSTRKVNSLNISGRPTKCAFEIPNECAQASRLLRIQQKGSQSK